MYIMHTSILYSCNDQYDAVMDVFEVLDDVLLLRHHPKHVLNGINHKKII